MERKIMQNRRQRYGLKKYDAPLRIQYDKGAFAFKRGTNKNPYHFNTMQHREWQRGYNFAYFANLKKVKEYESRNRGKRVHGK